MQSGQVFGQGRTVLQPSRWALHWYERDKARFVLEQRVMVQKFPQFRLFRQDDALCWLGQLTTNRGNGYELLVRYPDEFPYKAPLVYPYNPVLKVTDPLTGKPKHQYPDGRLCLYFPGDETFSPNTTAASVVAVAAAWLFAYELWLEAGCLEWPGPEAPEEPPA